MEDQFGEGIMNKNIFLLKLFSPCKGQGTYFPPPLARVSQLILVV